MTLGSEISRRTEAAEAGAAGDEVAGAAAGVPGAPGAGARGAKVEGSRTAGVGVGGAGVASARRAASAAARAVSAARASSASRRSSSIFCRSASHERRLLGLRLFPGLVLRALKLRGIDGLPAGLGLGLDFLCGFFGRFLFGRDLLRFEGGQARFEFLDPGEGGGLRGVERGRGRRGDGRRRARSGEHVAAHPEDGQDPDHDRRHGEGLLLGQRSVWKMRFVGRTRGRRHGDARARESAPCRSGRSPS